MSTDKTSGGQKKEKPAKTRAAYVELSAGTATGTSEYEAAATAAGTSIDPNTGREQQESYHYTAQSPSRLTVLSQAAGVSWTGTSHNGARETLHAGLKLKEYAVTGTGQASQQVTATRRYLDTPGPVPGAGLIVNSGSDARGLVLQRSQFAGVAVGFETERNRIAIGMEAAGGIVRHNGTADALIKQGIDASANPLGRDYAPQALHKTEPALNVTAKIGLAEGRYRPRIQLKGEALVSQSTDQNYSAGADLIKTFPLGSGGAQLTAFAGLEYNHIQYAHEGPAAAGQSLSSAPNHGLQPHIGTRLSLPLQRKK